ncbi:MAG: hypothetical protein AB2728_15150 [Candidatus Thiodiazotropha sp.]|nr:formate dehydrogenase [Candidatus Thiodiazotropha taylori]MBT3059125.1 formate dehydrogenase [Candidatus Thiodiazotropha sp. (ex Lucina pensylvanica)]MBV2096970.1 formate dehydrogenase [Candidatus Thiodiazotropha sp. (ex Codakia orbicularis)]PUB78610.1 MAG: formate dehydrogenase [gamma proteobacterium symbiont of Ctena orbiculata]MBT3064928.1 formate dehydrogenase [Candidatus Thiodiazotropha sp. (ex Lucina pensylvanica)]
MKKELKQTPDQKRRAFLRGSATAGVGAAVAVSLPGLTTASIEDEASAEAPKAKKGYRLTPHIAAYYKSTVS